MVAHLVLDNLTLIATIPKKSGQRNPGWDLATTHRTTLDLLRQRTKRPRKEASRRNVCKTGARMRGNTCQADPACKQSRAYPSREETCRGQHSVHEVEGAVTQPAVDIIPEHSKGHKEANCLLLQITATNSTRVPTPVLAQTRLDRRAR